MSRIIFGGSSCEVLAREVGSDLELGVLTIRKFPDGERYIRIESEVEGKECIVIQSTNRPQDENILELLGVLSTLRDLEAKRIIAVVPFYGYGRQDKRFTPGECVTAKTIAQLIQLYSDEFITINIHKEHILDFFEISSCNLDAGPLLGRYFKNYDMKDPLVIGPDKGALKLAKTVAKECECAYDYLEKKRIGPGNVEMKPREVDVKGRDVVLVDDIIDSGGTMLEAMKKLKVAGASNILIGCIHPVLTGNIITRLYSYGAKKVVATNTIPTQISEISVASLIRSSL